MALHADIVWEVRSGGDAGNGGGFKTGASGTDYSQQTAAQKSGTDLTIHASDNTKILPVVAGVAAADIGNLVQVTAGTNFTVGFYEITAQDGTYWTVDRAVGTIGSTGGTYKMGGAVIHPQNIDQAVVAGNDIYILGPADYDSANGVTAFQTAVAGVPSNKCRLIGFTVGNRATALTTNRPSGTDRPRIRITGGAAVQGVRIEHDDWFIANLRIDNNVRAAHGLYMTSSRPTVLNCDVQDCDIGFYHEAPTTFVDCTASDCDRGWYHGHGATCFACRADDCDTAGFYAASASVAWVRCIASNNLGAACDGYRAGAGVNTHMIHCVAYKNGRHGMIIPTPGMGGLCWGNIFAENGVSAVGYGISAADNHAAAWQFFADYNAFYNGATQDGALNNLAAAPHDVTLSGDPFTAAASGDFSLNNTAGAGADCRADGYPSYLDIGALQHQETGSAGLARLVGPGGLVSA